MYYWTEAFLAEGQRDLVLLATNDLVGPEVLEHSLRHSMLAPVAKGVVEGLVSIVIWLLGLASANPGDVKSTVSGRQSTNITRPGINPVLSEDGRRLRLGMVCLFTPDI